MSYALPREVRTGSRLGMAGTTLLHAGLVAAVVILAREPAPPVGTVYRVNLVAAPAPSQARRVATETVAPPPQRTAPTQTRTTRSVPVTPTAPPRAATPTEAAPRVANPVEPLPGETPSTGTSIANVNLQGMPFPFEGYLENLVEQVVRRWARPAFATPLRAEVSFTILRDGTVRNIKIAVPSRNFTFDMEAMGAIESAGRARAFGPLPTGFEADSLPMIFYFAPRTGR